MRIECLRASVEARAEREYARSSGPGGQNVNKVETKVRVRVDLGQLEGLSEAERARVGELLAGRLDAEGKLYVAADGERSRAANEAIALARMLELIVKAARFPKKRIATRPGRAAKERRLSGKKQRSGIKQGRGRPSVD
jgi:ribosome-associated protein